MRLLSVCALFFLLSFNAHAQLKQQFIYNGEDEQTEVNLYGIKVDRDGYYLYSVKTNVTFNFDPKNKHIGTDELIEVRMNDLDIGMAAAMNNDVLTMIKLNDVWRVRDVDEWFVYFIIDVHFAKGASTALYFLKEKIEDIMVEDDYLSFTTGKISPPQLVNARIKVIKTSGRDKTLFDFNVLGKDMELTEFGPDRTLVTMDLAELIDMNQIERGESHKIEVELKSNTGQWKIISGNLNDQTRGSNKTSIKTKFRYSD